MVEGRIEEIVATGIETIVAGKRTEIEDKSVSTVQAAAEVEVEATIRSASRKRENTLVLVPEVDRD